MNKYLLLFIGLVIVVLAGWYLYTRQTPPISTVDNFVHDGVVIKDNPGFKPGVWFLSYEEPGSSGLSVELDLNSVPAPYISLTQGERVHVVGNLQGSVVIVSAITQLKDSN